ncbi:MAG: hypothetical protein J2P36_21825 [Ktedonobacteraceae bacterium]|nr:hypothetical protein [Ktedonobacteraceae bacterium]
MELAIEKRISCLLRELFGAVQVNGVTLTPQPQKTGYDPAFSCCANM